jgi:N-methylhydantoinase A
MKADFSRTIPRAGALDARETENLFAALEGEAAAWFEQERVPPADRSIARIGMLRYQGQGNELAIPWPDHSSQVEAAFADAHESLYGFTLPAPIELVTIRVEATGHFPPPAAATIASGTGFRATRTTEVHFASGTVAAALLDRGELGAGDRVAGPAIITQLDATTVVRPGWTCEVRSSGALVISA